VKESHPPDIVMSPICIAAVWSRNGLAIATVNAKRLTNSTFFKRYIKGISAIIMINSGKANNGANANVV